MDTQEKAARRDLRKRRGENVVRPPVPWTGQVRITCDGKPLTVLVKLCNPSSSQRRELRKLCAHLGCHEKPVQWIERADGERIPLWHEITGPRGIVERLRESAFVAQWQWPMDTPVFVRGNGAASDSAAAVKAMKRRTLPKAEREARYQRDSIRYDVIDAREAKIREAERIERNAKALQVHSDCLRDAEQCAAEPFHPENGDAPVKVDTGAAALPIAPDSLIRQSAYALHWGTREVFEVWLTWKRAAADAERIRQFSE